MGDFQDALRARLERNAELAEQDRAAQEEMDRLEAQREAENQRRADQAAAARRQQHADLVAHVELLAGQLAAASPQDLDIRAGWSTSGEEYLVRASTVRLRPARRLEIELDRDDDEVLVRWKSDLGDALEMWRLLEVTPEMLTELLLQLVDQEAWRGEASLPPFPVAR